MKNSLLLGSELAKQWRYSRGNPIANLVPVSLVAALTQFDLGWFRQFSLVYNKLEDGADFDITTCAPKRRSSVSSLDYEIVAKKGAKASQAARMSNGMKRGS